MPERVGGESATGASAPKAEEEQTAKPAPQSASDEESDALDEVFRTPSTDPQEIIRGLDAFLARFPQSARREQVLRTIFRRAVEANDPRKAAEAAEKLLEKHPNDPDLLSAAADQFDRIGDATSREKSISFQCPDRTSRAMYRTCGCGSSSRTRTE